MPIDSNLSKFDRLHQEIKSLEENEDRLLFIFDLAYSFLDSEKKTSSNK